MLRSSTQYLNGSLEGPIFLSEERALARARQSPDRDRHVYIAFGLHDKKNSRNWARWKKWYITCFVSLVNIPRSDTCTCLANVLSHSCLCAGGNGSGTDDLSASLDFSSEVGTLELSMYILGFAIGPLMLAPLSEYYDRNPIYIISWLLLVIFQIPLALANNIGTVLVCRLLQGFFGNAPLTNTGGTVNDLWARNESGPAMAIYGLSSTFGPPFALVISGWVVLYLGWRTSFWVYMAVWGGIWVLLRHTVPETRHSIILERKTKRLRKQLRSEGLAATDQVRDSNADDKRGLVSLFATTLTRPYRFLFTEP